MDPTIPPDADSFASLALRLHQRIPAHALAFTMGHLSAVAWHTGDEDGHHFPAGSPCYMHILHASHGNPTRLSMARKYPFSVVGAMKAMDDPDTTIGVSLVLRETRHLDAPEGTQARMDVLGRIARGTNAEALLLMDDTSLSGEATYDWLSGGQRDTAPERDFVRNHPWLAVWAAVSATDGWAGLLRSEGVDRAAGAVLANVMLEQDPRIPALVRRLRHFVLPETSVGEVQDDHVRALLDLPHDLFPPPLAPGDDPRGDAQQGYLALYTLAKDVAILSRITGRPLRSILGKVDSWAAYAAALPRRAGLEEEPANYPDDWGAIIPGDVVREIFDMVRIFANEVLAPALAMRGTPWAGPFAFNAGGRSFEQAGVDEVMVASTKLLLGERTLAALAETCGRWHVHTNAISRLIAGLGGDRAPKGPLLMPDNDIGDGLYLTCLNTIPALLDEGAPGPDATGALGLFHCVGGFGYQVAMGETCIISVRRRLPDGGYERVSTIEVDFDAVSTIEAPHVVQHQGRKNAPPDEGIVLRANLALYKHRHAGYEALQAFVPSPEAWETPSDAIVRTGSWEAVREAWAFALTKPLRTASPDELLRAGGL